jgi:hypothetical protein
MPGGRQTGHKKERAIAALLVSKTLDDAALQAGISLRTLKTWLKEKSFALAYRQARAMVLDRTVARLLAASGKAAETLEAALDTDDRVRAAKILLDQAVRGVELLDLAERIAALEHLVNRGNDNGFSTATNRKDRGNYGDRPALWPGRGNGNGEAGGEIPPVDRVV